MEWDGTGRDGVPGGMGRDGRGRREGAGRDDARSPRWEGESSEWLVSGKRAVSVFACDRCVRLVKHCPSNNSLLFCMCKLGVEYTYLFRKKRLSLKVK